MQQASSTNCRCSWGYAHHLLKKSSRKHPKTQNHKDPPPAPESPAVSRRPQGVVLQQALALDVDPANQLASSNCHQRSPAQVHAASFSGSQSRLVKQYADMHIEEHMPEIVQGNRETTKAGRGKQVGITELSPAALGFGPGFVSGLRAPGARRPTGGTPPACCPQPRKAPLGT